MFQLRLLLACLLTLLGSLVFGSPSWGHAMGENYVWVNVGESRLEGHFEIHARDLEQKLGIDVKAAGTASEQLVADTAAKVQQYIREHFRIYAGDRLLPLEFGETTVLDLPLGRFAQYHYQTPEFEIPDKLRIVNDMLFENDRFHRSLLAIEYNRRTGANYGPEYAAMVFSASDNDKELDLTDVPAVLQPLDFIWQGMLHIWIGIDHILFLVALLLPAVLIRDDQQWQPVSTFRAAFWNVLKIVTLFTVAHSITLSLAALDIVSLPSQLVESAIALSIILVALNCIFPKFRESSWLIIFFFGLFHGLGFASVMGELPFRMVNLLKVMLGFNIGVEIGQIAIVAILFPIIFGLRNSKGYVPLVLKGGAFAICLLASYWFVERAFAL